MWEINLWFGEEVNLRTPSKTVSVAVCPYMNIEKNGASTIMKKQE